MSNYYLVKTKGNKHIVIYDSIEALLAGIYYYYDEYDGIRIEKVYRVYDFKRNDLLGTSIFVDKQAKEILMNLSKGDIKYYLFKKTDDALTGVGRKCVAPAENIRQIINNNL